MSNSCWFEHEGYCTLKLEFPNTERCKLESIKEDEMIAGINGRCKAKESDLTEICEDCYEEIDGCSCSEEIK